MKKQILLIIIGFFVGTSFAGDSTKFVYPINNWNLRLIGFENLYPTYLADPLGARFELSSQAIKYSDFDTQDKINEGEGYTGKFVFFVGARMSLLKFSPNNNSKLGFEVDLGCTIPIFMRAGNNDFIGVDGIYYFSIAGNPTEWLSLRFAKHHICTHIGDEFYTGNVNSVIDFDPNMTQLPVRDDFILSAAVKPLYFLKKEKWNILQIYGELGYFWPGVDFLGTRQNKPNKHAVFNFQAGAEVEYYFKRPLFGGFYAAYNVSAYQSNAFSLNKSLNFGYIIPQERDKRKLRLGVNFYNGRALSNQFYNRKEKFIAFSLAMDV